MENDISKCTDTECTKRMWCYRYTEIPDRYQAYSGFTQKDGHCEYFYKGKPKYHRHIKELDADAKRIRGALKNG